MKAPSKPDYVKTYFTLYERFEQEQKNDTHRGHPFDYQAKCLILFFTIMIILRITPFKTQHRWLVSYPAQRQRLGLAKVPDRTTLLRRYRRLYPTLQAFIAYLGHWAESLGPEFDSRVLIENASLFKAQGPVWHQSDRKAGRVPDKLRYLDQDASWGKSAYHG